MEFEYDLLVNINGIWDFDWYENWEKVGEWMVGGGVNEYFFSLRVNDVWIIFNEEGYFWGFVYFVIEECW